MDSISFHLDVISGVGSLYSGSVKSVRVTGSEGEMGIRYGHAPLLTTIKTGMVSLIDSQDKEDQIYLAGGVLEVQPDSVTILADTALRADDIDEAKAQEAIKNAKESIANHGTGDTDYAHALSRLADAMARLKVVETARNRRR
ncbi:MAG: F0F1 ATP synthase subunit epsilon [Succinivibrio sp.]|uniref:F0F1 ATP synthase subunit epsilon n=2 Tax=Succinivibrio sp. TaxID=2053619 RepID=UPI000D7B2777|nr:F0F1 ATP synthase subunit epsilon [Succinivibrio sp.]MCI7253202.1 F0F1 ATP synthase subunit epsilon [Succinatimonas sp.]MDD6377680.1 F0F1 ATP synthase subunit epsilon [Succinatimonas sp.]MDY5995275.1 F0F1 ATP synthase subunit epsilon [Succinivibrio sp.]PWM82250.1 MAG: F0F1 ATP synthase subunit epsilon [Succinivibrio sp.]